MCFFFVVIATWLCVYLMWLIFPAALRVFFFGQIVVLDSVTIKCFNLNYVHVYSDYNFENKYAKEKLIDVFKWKVSDLGTSYKIWFFMNI